MNKASKLFLTSDNDGERSSSSESGPPGFHLQIRELKKKKEHRPPTLKAMQMVDPLPSRSLTPAVPKKERALRSGELPVIRSLPSVRQAGPRFLSQLRGSPVSFEERDRIEDSDVQTHKKYIERKLETLVDYMVTLEQRSKLTFQEFLSHLMNRTQPKYSFVSDSSLRQVWPMLQESFDLVYDQIIGQRQSIQEEEKKFNSLKKRQAHTEAQRELIREHLEEVIKKRKQHQSFHEGLRQAKTVLDKATEHIKQIVTDDSLMKRRAKYIFEKKYKESWEAVKMTDPRQFTKAKQIANYEKRDFWQDYSFFSKYDKTYKPAFVRKPRPKRLPALTRSLEANNQTQVSKA